MPLSESSESSGDEYCKSVFMDEDKFEMEDEEMPCYEPSDNSDETDSDSDQDEPEQ